MSGVIDERDQQWERCNGCGDMFKFPESLGHQKPNKHWPYGRMLCVKCVDAGLRNRTIKFREIVPAPSWKAVKVSA